MSRKKESQLPYEVRKNLPYFYHALILSGTLIISAYCSAYSSFRAMESMI